ncbi:phospho-N-acetylmuramoyl-pentapeptide-transferase, partial [Prochlorococcus sp. AH-716-I09]|nr:phospho-N-acetylmuramoyl-pentapeptide-transferase [Prochlorococcus sp. AH-716-I09]
MTGKIKKLDFKSLLLINSFALIITCYFFNSFIFIGVYALFFVISLLTTKS